MPKETAWDNNEEMGERGTGKASHCAFGTAGDDNATAIGQPPAFN